MFDSASIQCLSCLRCLKQFQFLAICFPLLSSARTGFVVFGFVFWRILQAGQVRQRLCNEQRPAKRPGVQTCWNCNVSRRKLQTEPHLCATFGGLASCVSQKFFVLAAWAASWSSPEACQIAWHRCTPNWPMICSSELRPQQNSSSSCRRNAGTSVLLFKACLLHEKKWWSD